MASRALHIYDLRSLATFTEESGSVPPPNKLDIEPWQRRESSLKFMTRAVACMPNDAGYASSSIEGRVAVEWFDPSSESQDRKYAFKCHRQNVDGVDVVYPVNALTFHPTFGTFASGGGDGVVALWDGIAKRRIRQYQKYPSSVAALSFSSNGKYLAIGVRRAVSYVSLVGFCRCGATKINSFDKDSRRPYCDSCQCQPHIISSVRRLSGAVSAYILLTSQNLSMTQSFASTFAGPTSKERKYDRQLRLWAASGQQALEDSRVLLVNSDGAVGYDDESVTGVVGVETLKNLVLPGIGGFTIVDPAKVRESDLGVNFFLSEDSLGGSRAEETCKYLKELNPDVDGLWSSQPILQILSQNSGFLVSYRLVIVTGPMRQSTLQVISQQTAELSIPLIYVHSVGFYCSFSLQLPSVFPVVETHPDPDSMQDLRLTKPWPELLATTNQIQRLEALDDHQHGHVPYLLLLLYYLEEWKRSHDGRYPQSYKEKTEFREMVRRGARTNNPEGGEENFDEAAAAVLKSVGPWSLNRNVRDLFEMDDCSNLNAQSDNFWVISHAIKTFYKCHDVLPLPGTLPDMKAQSSDYISLQNLYKTKARKDLAEVVSTVRAIETQLGPDRVVSPISEKEIEVFCKNAAHIKVVKGRKLPFVDSDAPDKETVKAIRNNIENPESLIPIFLSLRALDILVTEYQEKRLHSTSSSSYLDDPTNWQRAMYKLMTSIQANDSDCLDDEAQANIQNTVTETRRAGVGDLHNISALAGGFVAQEALKVLTKQYVPLDNTFLFDGVKGRGEMFRL
ncbi:hypothetical protein UREG_04624 [Uncinocarpus reesii 1704]|uniref:THIF-type NAD/FAD binding fold domain-containing protein n=1 Tax=Uncinocarpus reesii (strain UAMH 1704) TaxID=336963 RepID=C4JPY1_UNCRE|nr:uncharacterized protein UREG_04624 [Uncinocarpus reesii 1704]EEP79778.1 hypothetical protein UREG_04624 [Uncinocarpus reesii 1704]